MAEGWWAYFHQGIVLSPVWRFQEESEPNALPGAKVLHQGWQSNSESFFFSMYFHLKSIVLQLSEPTYHFVR
jgi:GT2 family glycosyltransferase